MVFEVINNPAFSQAPGFTQEQFRKLDQLYCMSASRKALNYRTVDCDFELGLASYTYYVSSQHAPYLQFAIRQVGPKTMMYEVYKQDKGRIVKSGVFDRAYERLCQEIECL